MPDLARRMNISNLDKDLKRLKRLSTPTRSNLPAVAEGHLRLARLLGANAPASSMTKRSLASKYLHFRMPNLVLLYDSCAASVVRKFLPRWRVPERASDQADAEFWSFCHRLIELRRRIEEQSGKTLTPREMDRFLVFA